MPFHTHIPGPPLDQYIDRFWLSSDSPSRGPERILPSGTVDLVINLSFNEVRIYEPSDPTRVRRHCGMVVSGPYRDAFRIDPLERATLIGVHFRPGRAVPILGVPASELADAHVDLEDVWARSATELREQLSAATTPQHQFALLEEAFLVRLYASSPQHRAIPRALDAFEQADTNVVVSDLAERVGLSQRRFIQLFTASVGMTPKLYGRVRRFQRARQLARTPAEPDWAALAASCGFFDQSHLIRDFGEFAGLSPNAYRNQLNKHILHGPAPWVG